MAQRLVASPTLQKLLRQYKPLSKEEEIKYAEEYKKNKSEKAAMALLNGVSRLFANKINRHEGAFLKYAPEATYDDIFDTMVLQFFKYLHEFDPKKSKLNTWAEYTIMPIYKDPLRSMGDKFKAKHQVVDMDKPFSGSEDTIAEILPDGTIDIESEWERGVKNRKLQNAIRKLSPLDREIILNLMGYVKPPKKEWSKTLKDGTVTINASTIARGLNISPDRVRTRVANILKKLRSELAESNFDRYFELNRLIQRYDNPRKKWSKYDILNKE